MEELQFHFEWDDTKATANLQKHGVSFDLARTVFNDPRLLTVADLERSETEDRWFSVGTCASGAILSTAYLWKRVSEARVFVPASIEEGVWKYFSAKAAKKGVDVADLLTEVLRRDIEINEALR